MKWVCLLLATGTALAQSANNCAGLSRFQMAGAKIEITRAEMVPAGPAPTGRGSAAGTMLPAHCRVNGIMDRRTGPDGKTYGIRFAIALPDNWTGRYLQQGGGGLNGTVAEPIGVSATGTQPALARGFAVATRIQATRARAEPSTPASCAISRPRSISHTLPSDAWPFWPSRSSRVTTAARWSTHIMLAALRVVARR